MTTANADQPTKTEATIENMLEDAVINISFILSPRNFKNYF